MYYYCAEYQRNFIGSAVLSVVTIVIYICVNNVIVYEVFDAKKLYAGPKIVMISDISGISKATQHNYFPIDVNE